VKTFQRLQKLTALYQFSMKVYGKFPNEPLRRVCVKLYTEIEKMLQANPGLDLIVAKLEQISQQIRLNFNAAALILMNRPQAVQHLKNLIKERNDANIFFRREYEYVIRQTLSEFRALGFVFLIDTRSNDWRLLK
jgi:hypothetical protein